MPSWRWKKAATRFKLLPNELFLRSPGSTPYVVESFSRGVVLVRGWFLLPVPEQTSDHEPVSRPCRQYSVEVLCTVDHYSVG